MEELTIQSRIEGNRLVVRPTDSPEFVGEIYHKCIEVGCRSSYYIGDILIGISQNEERYQQVIDQLSPMSSKQYMLVSQTFTGDDRIFGVKWRYHRYLAGKISAGRLGYVEAVDILLGCLREGHTYEFMQGLAADGMEAVGGTDPETKEFVKVIADLRLWAKASLPIGSDELAVALRLISNLKKELGELVA